MRITISVILLSISLATQAQSVKITSEKDVDFTRYATFRIDKGEIVTLSDQRMDGDKIYETLKEAITQQLTEKGYKPADDSSADMVITYIGQIITRIDSETIGPLGQQPANNAAEVDRSRNWSRESSQGELVVEVTDPPGKKSIWRATSTLENVSLESERTLYSIAARSFKKFPSRKKK